MTRYTTEPWSQEESDGALVIGGQVIATPQRLSPDDATWDEMQAIARLMAAAPELLAACRVLVQLVPLGEMTSSHVVKAIEIVNKATGDPNAR